jgi:trehalose/maltose transport system substrate-binding protein
MRHTDNELAANSSCPEFPELLQNVGRRSFLSGLATFLLVAGQACKRADQLDPEFPLVLIDQTWLDNALQDWRNQELKQFTKETGIRVKLLPAPEGAEPLDAWRSFLESDAKIPDVYGVDVIWPGILAENLLDLKALVPAEEIATHFPELIANNTVNGKLVALPCLIDVGLLYYRTDLLRHYGYRTPPQTWRELESIATRIQAGERAKGQKDFWGFLWEGASSESLSCNALEWQVSEGGGPIIENNAVTVNNLETARAWERASRWVGTLSPPGIVSYKEWDAYNIWRAGQAAFMRNWAPPNSGEQVQGSLTQDQFGIASLPRGQAKVAATVGGRGYAISRHSLHPREASMLVRFLCRRDTQLNRSLKIGKSPTIPELYNDPRILADPYFSTILRTYRDDKVWRPSTEAGKRYPALSRAYFMAVHEVLAGKKPVATALADLQTELTQITGLNAPTPGASSGLQGRSAVLRAMPHRSERRLETKVDMTLSRF